MDGHDQIRPVSLHRPSQAAHPEPVGRAIHRAMCRSTGVIYVPWFWRPIMCAVRLLPEAVAKRLRW